MCQTYDAYGHAAFNENGQAGYGGGNPFEGGNPFGGQGFEWRTTGGQQVDPEELFRTFEDFFTFGGQRGGGGR